MTDITGEPYTYNNITIGIKFMYTPRQHTRTAPHMSYYELLITYNHIKPHNHIAQSPDNTNDKQLLGTFFRVK